MHEMKSNDARTIRILEMTAHCIANHIAQFSEGIGLREDSVPKGTRLISPFRAVHHFENDLGRHDEIVIDPACETKQRATPSAVAGST